MDKEIRIDDLCLDVAKSGAAVQMVKCHHMKGNQLWEFNEKVKIILWLSCDYSINVIHVILSERGMHDSSLCFFMLQ